MDEMEVDDNALQQLRNIAAAEIVARVTGAPGERTWRDIAGSYLSERGRGSGIQDPHNIQRVEALVGRYFDTRAPGYTKIVHHTLANYSDADIARALEYANEVCRDAQKQQVDDRGHVSDDPLLTFEGQQRRRREEERRQREEERRQREERQRREEERRRSRDRVLSCQGVEVTLQARALQHIHERYWDDVCNAISSSGYFKENEEYLRQPGASAETWLNLVLSGQEGRIKIVIVCNERTKKILIYHLHPEGYMMG